MAVVFITGTAVSQHLTVLKTAGLLAERRRAEAREQLHTAHHMLEAMGMDTFAERARRELRPPARPPQAHHRGRERE